MLQKTLTLLFLLTGLISHAQQLNHKQGEVIIQLHPKVENTQQLVQRLKMFGGKPTKLTIKKEVIGTMNIWLLKFDFTRIHEYRFIKAIQKNNLVQHAQVNHIIHYRNIPNDPDFMKQWQYLNDGVEGGSLEADLDADLAWDITTGGVTADGDTIVLAALDDGIDLNHEDFGDNLWHNHAEIPGNGVDDDNNGYIDDYKGWSIISESDDISGGGHGTPVMGIMGAKGNNGIGVTGVNWNVKVMMIRNDFRDDEASVIAAYGYPLIMRKKYNESKGQEGAFVVATNASWGVDMGFPEDAPIWCALYDSLGAAGILNCGATANENFNVDVVGDLPTTCPSDYLIGVTNVNRRGEKEFFAGFGKKNIDLGAFGEDVYTLANGNHYAPFGGTSGATPHVAGAIGLLYAAPCSNFSNIVKTNPAGAALLVKSYLLNGVKPNPNLDTITLAGGQLNLNNSLQLLMADCGPCPPPSLVDFSNILDTSTTINWVAAENAVTTDFRYRISRTSAWTEVKNAATPHLLTDLIACTDYEIQFKSNCRGENTDYIATQTFKTDGCCIPPENVKVLEKQNSSLQITWNKLLAAQGYEVRYSILGASNFQTLLTDTNTVILSNLNDCTDYEFQVRTLCQDKTTDYSPSLFPRTLGCGVCTDVTYCTIGGDGDFEWIANVQLNTLNHSSDSDGGYGDYTGFSTDLTTFDTFDLKVTPAFQSFSSEENLRVWIDYNQDGLFDEVSELVVDPDEDSADTLRAKIVIPGDAKAGLTRMRIAIKWRGGFDSSKATPCGTFDFGEVEDYCVNIITVDPPCTAPVNFMQEASPYTNLPDEVAATVFWNNPLNLNFFDYRARPFGTIEWQNFTFLETALNAVDILGLDACTNYEFQIRTNCLNGETSSFSQSYFFNAICPCPAISNFQVTDTTHNTISIAWDSIAFSKKYEVNFKEKGENNLSRIVVDKNSANLFGLKACSNYIVQIRGFCLDTEGAFSEQFEVTTKCPSAVTSLPVNVKELAIFPNPFKNKLRLEIDLKTSSDLALKLFDVSGKLLKNNYLKNIPSGKQQLDLNYKGLKKGVYLLSIETVKGKTIRRLIKL